MQPETLIWICFGIINLLVTIVLGLLHVKNKETIYKLDENCLRIFKEFQTVLNKKFDNADSRISNLENILGE